MNGTNELHLCTAEMMVAVQEYLNKRMSVYAPKVDDVRTTNMGSRMTFVIRLKAKKTPDA